MAPYIFVNILFNPVFDWYMGECIPNREVYKTASVVTSVIKGFCYQYLHMKIKYSFVVVLYL